MAGRDTERLETEAADILARSGAPVTTRRCDVLDDDGGAEVLAGLYPLPDVAICVVGLLGDQVRSERDGTAAEQVMRTNYVGPALLLGALAERFAQRGSGILVGVSSVAGERGRASNYVYGSAKAGFSAFLSGLRNRLAPSGVHVVTVKPGFVRTRMTAGRDLPALLTATPDEVAAAVAGALRTRQDVVYVRRDMAADHAGRPRRAGARLQTDEDLTRIWPGLLLLALLVIYLPDLGHGFIKDDFVWIEQNQAPQRGRPARSVHERPPTSTGRSSR